MEAFGCKELALAAKAAGSGDTQWVMLSIINQEECRPSVVALPTGNLSDSKTSFFKLCHLIFVCWPGRPAAWTQRSWPTVSPWKSWPRVSLS